MGIKIVDKTQADIQTLAQAILLAQCGNSSLSKYGKELYSKVVEIAETEPKEIKVK